MSTKYGNHCATYNIPLNNDDDDVFRRGCVHLYNFLHCKSAEYKPLMLKIHLEFIDSPSMREAEGKNIEQLEGVIKQYEAKLKTLEEAREQMDARIKTLDDAALLQTKSDGNKLIERVETIEKNEDVDKSPGGGNNITQDNSIEKLKQPSSDSHSNQQSYACTIFNIQRYSAYEVGNVIELAEKIGLSLTDDQIYYIDIYDAIGTEFRNYCVHFYNKDLRDEFLKKSHILEEFPDTMHLTISNETEFHTVVIENVEFTSFPINHVINIAKQMYLWLKRDQIKHIDVFENDRVYCVYFSNKRIKDIFLEKTPILKKFYETKLLEFH